eukprot:6639643-Prymnesium_polylepis.1
MPEISFCGAPVEARGGGDAGIMRCRGAAENAPGFEERDVGRARGHAHRTENCEDDTRMYVSTNVKNETSGKISQESRRECNGRNGQPLAIMDIIPDIIQATRPARNPPESTTLDRVASRPRPPPKGDAEG